MTFLLSILVNVAVMLVAAVGAQFIHGKMRLLLLAQGMLVSLGAYSYAIASEMGISAIGGLMLSCVVGGIGGIAILLISTRSIRDDFALVTFAIQVAFIAILINARSITGGALGISGVSELPGATIFGPHYAALIILGIVFLVQWFALSRLDRTFFGLSASVLARSRELAMTMGIRGYKIRLISGVFGGVSLALAGGVYAGYFSFIEPQTFGTNMSVLILALVFLSSDKLSFNIVVALGLLVVAPQLIRLIPSNSLNVGSFQMLLSGCVILGYAFFRMRSSKTRSRKESP